MKTTFALLLTILGIQNPPQMPRNNPNGTWESGSGTQYELRLNGTELVVKLVSTPGGRYISYDVKLKNVTEDINTYEGSGTFVAKLKDKECKFDTEWRLTVVNQGKILGATTNIVPDPDTCQIKEKSRPSEPGAALLDLTKR